MADVGLNNLYFCFKLIAFLVVGLHLLVVSLHIASS